MVKTFIKDLYLRCIAQGEAVVMKDLRNREKCIFCNLLRCLYECMAVKLVFLCGPILHWEMKDMDKDLEISILLELDPIK